TSANVASAKTRPSPINSRRKRAPFLGSGKLFFSLPQPFQRRIVNTSYKTDAQEYSDSSVGSRKAIGTKGAKVFSCSLPFWYSASFPRQGKIIRHTLKQKRKQNEKNIFFRRSVCCRCHFTYWLHHKPLHRRKPSKQNRLWSGYWCWRRR